MTMHDHRIDMPSTFACVALCLLMVVSPAYSSTAKPKAHPLGTECGVCEDIGQTYSNMYPCNLDDPGKNSPTECGFNCGMLCNPGEKGDCPRQVMCENAMKAVTTNEDATKYFWETGMCPDFTPYDQCQYAPDPVVKLMGGLKCHSFEESGQFDHDTLLVNNPECTEDPNCRAARPNNGNGGNSVSDECLVCYWVARSIPLFQQICRPEGVRFDCSEISKSYKVDSKESRRLRRLLEAAAKGAPLTGAANAASEIVEENLFKEGAQPGLGSPPLSAADNKVTPKYEECMKMWAEVAASRVAQTQLQCFEPPMEEGMKKQPVDPQGRSITMQCKCLCKCPYTEEEWMSLSSVCEYKPSECDLPHMDDISGRDPFGVCIDSRKPMTGTEIQMLRKQS